MIIGILMTRVIKLNSVDYYNNQQIGLVKSLCRLFEKVVCYFPVAKNIESYEEEMPGYNNIVIKRFPVRFEIGPYGIIDMKYISENIDALFYWSDTELAQGTVFKWCVKNNVTMIPYIGAITTYHPNKLIQLFVKLFSRHKVRKYNNIVCLTRNIRMRNELRELGLSLVEYAPVGLDLCKVKPDYLKTDIVLLKNKWGFSKYDKLLLFVGHFTPAKNPVRMLSIFDDVVAREPSYKLILVGTGVLSDIVNEEVEKRAMHNCVKVIKKIPNKDIWELFRIADAFVNLNKKEIVGMAILEAMYYEKKVIAVSAPGPDSIIENGINGYICDSDEEIINKILCEDSEIGVEAHKRVVSRFTWDTTAKMIYKIAQDTKKGKN